MNKGPKTSRQEPTDADVNGAVNIVRKSKVTAIQFNTVKQIRDIVAYPKRIRVA
jgi:hypothetical protein